MPPRLKRALWLSCLTALIGVGVLIGCWLLPGLIPANWRNPNRLSTQTSTESYLIPGATHVCYLQLDLTFTAQGAGLESSTLITAAFTDRLYPRHDNAGSVRGDRADALERIRAEVPQLCAAAGFPSVAARLDELVAAGKTGLTIEYPERKRAALLMSIRPYVMCAAAAALLVAAPLALYFLVVAIKSRRTARANCCTRCGYNLAGLATTALCPECGSDVAADLAKLAARAGRTRRFAGCVLLIVGLGLSITWFASAKGEPEGSCLLNHTSEDGSSIQQLWLVRGGVRYVTLSSPALAPISGISTTAVTRYFNQRISPGYADDLDPSYGGDAALPRLPIDWSLWHYESVVNWATMTFLWLSLWPLALLTLTTGGLLLASGHLARKRARKQ